MEARRRERTRHLFGITLMLCAMALFVVGCPGITPGDNTNDNMDNGNTNDNTDNGNANDNQTGDSGVTGKFAGATKCQMCHGAVHETWSATLHAGALETLEGIGQGANAACLPCHTVGFGEAGGYVDRATTNSLRGVQCENCHGAGAAHAGDPTNADLLPMVSIGASVCGVCHTGAHHPNFEQWQEAGHSQVTEAVAGYFSEGRNLNNCGTCHSGDFHYLGIIKGEAVPDDYLAGVPVEELTPITCAICHNPHMRTGYAAAPDEGRDFQLRYPQVAYPTPATEISEVTNPLRFNLCGQCHHSRGRTWTATTRGPHLSIQMNVYIGEMPVDNPEIDEPLVLGRSSTHGLTTEQCSTCHMYREDFESEQAPAISGHNFTINFKGCATAGCHPSAAAGQQFAETIRGEVEARIADIEERLGDPATWGYSAEGGPPEGPLDGEPDQTDLSDEIKQIRFLHAYILNDGSFGVHNPGYVRSMLDKAEDLLDEAGL
jgi:formate-dependent nitrite reductase cytochrome c552 subunit